MRCLQNSFCCNFIFLAATSSNWRKKTFAVIILRLKSFYWFSSSRRKI